MRLNNSKYFKRSFFISASAITIGMILLMGSLGVPGSFLNSKSTPADNPGSELPSLQVWSAFPDVTFNNSGFRDFTIQNAQYYIKDLYPSSDGGMIAVSAVYSTTGSPFIIQKYSATGAFVRQANLDFGDTVSWDTTRIVCSFKGTWIDQNGYVYVVKGCITPTGERSRRIMRALNGIKDEMFGSNGVMILPATEPNSYPVEVFGHSVNGSDAGNGKFYISHGRQIERRFLDTGSLDLTYGNQGMTSSSEHSNYDGGKIHSQTDGSLIWTNLPLGTFGKLNSLGRKPLGFQSPLVSESGFSNTQFISVSADASTVIVGISGNSFTTNPMRSRISFFNAQTGARKLEMGSQGRTDIECAGVSPSQDTHYCRPASINETEDGSLLVLVNSQTVSPLNRKQLLVRLNDDGTRDPYSFGPQGTYNISAGSEQWIYSSYLDDQERLVVRTGNSNSYLDRLVRLELESRQRYIHPEAR